MNYRKFGLMLLTAALAAMMACGIEDEPFGVDGTEIASPPAGSTPAATASATPSGTPDSIDGASSLIEDFIEVSSRSRGGDDIRSRVAISHYPRLYEPFTVAGIFEIPDSASEGEQYEARFWLSVPGAIVLDGEDRWEGTVTAGDERMLTATFALVTAGNQNAIAYSSALSEGGAYGSGTINFYSDDTTGEQYHRPNEIEVLTTSPGDPPMISAPHTFMSETRLALNESDSHRIELIAGNDDLERLQTEGLLPDSFIYEWWRLGVRLHADFSKFFFLAVYEPLADSPGCNLSYGPAGFLEWNEGSLTIPLESDCLPQEVERPDQPVSPMLILRFARNEILLGPRDEPLAYLANETNIEFTINGESIGQIQLDLGQEQ